MEKAEQVIDINNYRVGAEFIYHNKDVFLKKAGLDDECMGDGRIFDEMKSYFILPLIRDCIYWPIEFIRNLLHFGFKEFLYVACFYLYMCIYDLYSIYFHSMHLMLTPLCDFFIFLPAILAQTIDSYDSAGWWGYSLVYILLCYLVVYIPRVFLITIESTKRTLWIFGFKAYGFENYSYAIACALSLLYGASTAMFFYSLKFHLITSISGRRSIPDLYMRDCAASLVIFSIVRMIFLHTEYLLTKTPFKKKNLLVSRRDVFELKKPLIVFMVYTMAILGSLSFLYTYYSIARAVQDTSIVEDVKCINYVASKVCADPLELVLDISKKSLKNLFKACMDTISKYLGKAKEVTEKLADETDKLAQKAGLFKDDPPTVGFWNNFVADISALSYSF
ncbi:hypothetical protein NEMIN01_0186 [Nematocida minor]|uniref:uncharacterized protein n=1 Tax=Nematocida minor TaxID=1912983 RepID=UPI00221F654C|nr:uncharacterized protein NEMIN01_0082 [Nematocida minor]XP_051332088.1 uncharacterized protein NEMIN01_0186 [Nematocida minor]KAI5188818.1 hypothetical protein NEMIN01_0082 [Nematocida minor]KAI5188922.1 hypothetical protein NEMIN01_0186 [Nematocida minor]